MLKHQNPLLSYIRETEKVHCKCTMQCTVHSKCTMQCTVHVIITLFNVGNVLLCEIYQLNMNACVTLSITVHVGFYAVFRVSTPVSLRHLLLRRTKHRTLKVGHSRCSGCISCEHALQNKLHMLSVNFFCKRVLSTKYSMC
jgi:hypothetical protein